MSDLNNPHTQRPYSPACQVLRWHAAQLPVSQHMPQLLRTIRRNAVTIIVGETGSGKSTQIPKRILESMSRVINGDICLTQPRKLAAESVAKRIAQEMEVRLGSIVGLRHRDHDSTSTETHLEIHTDGVTLALAKNDPMLRSFGAVIIDEAHEYSREADVLLGHLKTLLDKRNDLKVVIMSASIDTALFTQFLPQAVVQEISGRRHEVTLNYLEEPSSDLIADIIKTIIYVHCTQMPGDILVFVSGKDEINMVIDGVKRCLQDDMGPLRLCSLHGSLGMEDQNSAIDAHQPQARHDRLERRVIVSTNSAETSLTIESITHIIDSCKANINAWDPYTESFAMINQPISKASVLHRKGRAGRTYEGMSWLMCTEKGYHEDLVEHSVLQVLQGDMLRECLTIMKLGHNPITFDYIVAPAPETIVRALGLLRQLGAVDPDGTLSSRGSKLAAIPTNVYAAMTLLESSKIGCSDEAITIMAMIEATKGGSYLFRRAQGRQAHARLRATKSFFQHPSGEHLTLFNIYMAWREACHTRRRREFFNNHMLLEGALLSADGFRLHYLESMDKIEGWYHRELRRDNPHYYTRILQALAAGHFLHTAKRIPRSEGYQLVRSGMEVSLSRHTDLGRQSKHNEWVIYNDCSNEGTEKVVRVVSPITPELLVAAQPEYWWDAEFLPEGHIQDGLLQTLANMIGYGGIIPLGMPFANWPDLRAPTLDGLATWVLRRMITGNKRLENTLPLWKKERDDRSAKVKQLEKWDLKKAVAAGFDDGSSRYAHPDRYHPSSFSIGEIDAGKTKKMGNKYPASIASSD